MKKLLLIALTGLALFTGASFADDISAYISPVTQQGISGSTVTFTLNVVNTTGVICKVNEITLYHSGISSINSSFSLSPIQIPGATSRVPRSPQLRLMQLTAGQTGTVAMSGTILLSSRNVIDLTGVVRVTCSGTQTIVPISGMQVLPIADLQITKSIQGPLPYFSGELVTYLISVKNIGSTGATDVTVLDTRPIGVLNFVSANPVYTSPLFTFVIGDLQPGQQQNITMVGSLKPSIAPGTIFSNTATTATTSSQYTIANDSVLVTGNVLTADLNLFSGSVTSPLPEQSGDVVNFSLWYNNAGPAMSGQRTISVSGTNTSGQITPDYFLANQTGNMGVIVNVNNNYAPGTPICLHATISGTLENGPLTNNTITICTQMAPLADLYITKTLVPFTGYAAGSIVTYILNYGNAGGKVVSGVVIGDTFPGVISTTQVARNIGTLQAGQTGAITVTGVLNTTLSGGTTFVNTAIINGNGLEVSTGNNSSTVTGTIASLAAITLDIQANNITRPSYDNPPHGSGANIMIQAISGDVVQLSIAYANNGNMPATNSIISLAGLSGFVSLGTYSGAVGNLGIGQTGLIIITGIVGPQNYITFTPVATLTYNTTQTVSDSVIIQEPLVCGDGFITMNEQCDTNGQIGLLRSGQVCENHANVCVVVTKDIINTACLDYRYISGSGHICDDVQFPLVEEVGQCRELDVHGSNVILADEEDDNYVGDADFTCYAENGIANTITIDCGNGEIHTGTNVSSFDATCHYNETSVPKDRTVQCYVDGQTQDECTQHMIIDQAIMSICGDGHLDPLEDCDLGTNGKIIGNHLDKDGEVDAEEYANKGYSCYNCDIREGEKPVGDMAACFSLNGNNISVQEDELLPFRWKIDLMGDKTTNECGDDDEGKILRDSLMCEFRIFNGAHQESESVNEDVALTVDSVDDDDNNEKTITLPCDTDTWTKNHSFGAPSRPIFDYFHNQSNMIRSLDNADGRYAITMDGDILSNGGNEEKIYGEYNIALYRINYRYCIGKDEDKAGTPIDRVCETDFVVTKPYLAQKSSFGLTPRSTSIKLEDYQDIFGDSIIKRTDLDKIMVLDAEEYEGGTKVDTLMTSFVSKYEKLAIKVTTINNGAITVSKVPSQNIFVFKGNGTITLSKDSNRSNFKKPFTVIIDGADLVVQGSMTNANGMFLVKGGNILFENAKANDAGDRCPETQIVQGIFVTDQGFSANENENLSNTNKDELRCSHGGLYIKGVLIGKNIDQLVQDRRSQLNHWFYAGRATEPAVLAERRNEIFNGAAVEIEYSPSLRSNLPPGASDFTKALDVYKK